MANSKQPWWRTVTGRRRDPTSAEPEATAGPGARPFIDAWRDNVRPYDDVRLERLGDVLASALEASDGHAIRASLMQALLSNVESTAHPAGRSEVHEWSVAQEELADDLAWAAEDRDDSAEYDRCFKQARAYGAVRAVSGESDDASAIQDSFYELLHSVEVAGDVLVIVAAAPEPWPSLVRGAGQP